MCTGTVTLETIRSSKQYTADQVHHVRARQVQSVVSFVKLAQLCAGREGGGISTLVVDCKNGLLLRDYYSFVSCLSIVLSFAPVELKCMRCLSDCKQKT